MPARIGSRRVGQVAADTATYVLLSIFSLIILVPILWIVRLSFTTKFVDSLRLLRRLRLSQVQHRGPQPPAGILGLQMLPPIVLSIPIFILMKSLNVLNTRGALVASYLSFNLPFLIWMLMGFVDGIPRELEAAALIDGASRFQCVMRIVFPLAAPGIMAAAILSFILGWNEFLFALMLTAEKTSTVPIALAAMQTERGVMLGPLAAATSLAVIPMIILSITIQKYLVRGLTFGALK